MRKWSRSAQGHSTQLFRVPVLYSPAPASLQTLGQVRYRQCPGTLLWTLKYCGAQCRSLRERLDCTCLPTGTHFVFTPTAFDYCTRCGKFGHITRFINDAKIILACGRSARSLHHADCIHTSCLFNNPTWIYFISFHVLTTDISTNNEQFQYHRGDQTAIYQ